MNHGIAWIVAAQFFVSTPYQAAKTFWLVVKNTDSNITQWKDQEYDHNSLSSLKPSSNLEL